MTKLVRRFALLSTTLITSLYGAAQSQCNNQDFDDSTFVGWTPATGTNMNGVLMPVIWTNGLISNGNNAAVSDVNARHTIITQNTLDPLAVDSSTMLPDTQMTSLAPGGGIASIRLGNSNMNYECEKVSFPFTVSANNPWFQFQFSSVMEDPGHLWNEQPYFMVNFYDQGGNPIVACNDTIWAADTTVPFIHSGNNFYVLYRRWTPLSRDLSAYVGQQVTVEFVNSDCMYGGHYGYTNIDVSCIGSAIANVWPGDCDYDLQANNVDLLTLGIAYGATGSQRANATTTWQAEPSTDWSQSIALGANYKHSDTNGDGIIDLNDTLAITQNYGQTHTFRLQNPNQNGDVQSTPMLYLNPVQDTVGELSYAYIDIYLANASMPVNDLYGLSFTINYNNTLVQNGTVSTDFTGSFVGAKNTSMITLARDNFATGQNDIALCRFTHTEVNGYGYVGTMRILTENVASISNLGITLSNIKAINSQGVSIPLSGQGCQVVIDPNVGIMSQAPTNHIGLYPNPAYDQLTVSTTAAETIEITDAVGRVVYSGMSTGTNTTINVRGFASGMYFVNVYSAGTKTTERLIVE
jgi:hypothetical protein